MAEHGRQCRPSQRRSPREAEPFVVKLEGERVQIELHGRRVRTLDGTAAEQVKRALADGDDAELQRIVARKVGRFARRGSNAER